MAEIARGTVRAYDAATHRATIELHASRALYASAIPVNRAITAADVVPGRACIVVFPNPGDYADAQIVSVH